MPARMKAERGWVTPTEAARDYIGIPKCLVVAGINSKELAAYEVPMTRRRAQSNSKTNLQCIISTQDIDEWIKSTFERVDHI